MTILSILIVAECNVNQECAVMHTVSLTILIVAECNVNAVKIQEYTKINLILIVAECNVNSVSSCTPAFSVVHFNSSRV